MPDPHASQGLRAVLYARVSKDSGDQEPEVQLAALREWCANRGWRVVGQRQDCATGDPHRRGRNPPGLVAALSAIETKKADVLAIFAADRLVRSPGHLLQLVAQVQAAGGRVASLQDGSDLDTTTDQGELMLFLRGWMARMELRLTRARTIAGLQRARAEGKQLGRRALALPDLAQLSEFMAAGVHGRRALAQALNCSPWAVRRALAELAKNGSAAGAAIPTKAGA